MKKLMFESWDLGGLTLPNRIVMAPMTRSRVSAGDAPTQMNAEYYAQRASCGLIVSEAIVVEPRGRGYAFTPGLYSAEQVAGWTAVTKAVHQAGGRIFAQLWHVGRVGHWSLYADGGQPIGPTDQPLVGVNTFGFGQDGVPGPVAASPPRAMTARDIQATIDHFVQAANNAVSAGFDGVEILAANGYLFEQFQNSLVNTRSDDFGGQSSSTRARLLLDTIDRIRARLPTVQIGVRLSPYGRFNGMPEDPAVEETYLYIARALADRQVTYCHFNDEPVSIGHLNQDAVHAGGESAPPLTRRLIPPTFLREFYRQFGRVVILCGGLDAALGEQMLQDGLADLVAFGIPFIANPDLPERLLNGWPLATPDTSSFYGGDRKGYSDYPRYVASICAPSSTARA